MKKPEVITRAEQWSEYNAVLLELILEELKKMNKEKVFEEKTITVAEPTTVKKRSKTKKTE